MKSFDARNAVTTESTSVDWMPGKVPPICPSRVRQGVSEDWVSDPKRTGSTAEDIAAKMLSE